MNTDLSVLIIDDDDAMRYGLGRELKKCGCRISEKSSVEDAKYPGTHMILVSCSMDSQRTTLLMSKGASLCMQKPVFEQQCRTAISTLLSDSDLKAA